MSEVQTLKSEKVVLVRGIRFSIATLRGSGNHAKLEIDYQAGKQELPASPSAPLDYSPYTVRHEQVYDLRHGGMIACALIEHQGKKYVMPFDEFERCIPYQSTRKLYTNYNARR